MTEPVWNEAAWTTTVGSTFAIVLAAAFTPDKSTSCAMKRAGQSNIAARALPAVESHFRRSRLRPAMTILMGADAMVARSSAIRPAKLPVPKIRMSARMSVTVPCAAFRCTFCGLDGRQRHAHDPQRRCDHRRRPRRHLDGAFPSNTWPLGLGD